VLMEHGPGVVMRTTDEGVSAMNRLPVELARIRMRPMVLSGADATEPVLPALTDSTVWQLVNRVSQDSFEGFLDRLVGFYTRYATHDSAYATADWLVQRFEEFGCDTVYLQPFRGGYAPNAIGVKYGTVNPQRIYGICGHFDNTSDQQPHRCPGSDDNGSGTSAVLEACRVFQDVEFENTVWFLGFGGEEQGLYGSEAFARAARSRGDSVLAMLNFDMISYGRENIDTFEIIGKWSNPACEWLVDFYIAQADTFSTLKAKKTMTNYAPYSDHHSFWEEGYVAFCGIENDFTPMYHTIGDTVGPLYYRNCGTNNLPLATDATRAAVATLAKLAGASIVTGVEETSGMTRPVRVLGVEPSLGSAPLTLRLSRPLASSGTVEVYDATGRVVRTLGPAQGPDVSWDGLDESGVSVSTGIYLFRVTDAGRTHTAKAVLTD